MAVPDAMSTQSRGTVRRRKEAAGGGRGGGAAGREVAMPAGRVSEPSTLGTRLLSWAFGIAPLDNVADQPSSSSSSSSYEEDEEFTGSVKKMKMFEIHNELLACGCGLKAMDHFFAVRKWGI